MQGREDGTHQQEAQHHGRQDDGPGLAEELPDKAPAAAAQHFPHAYFPGPRRLAVLQNGQVTVYDTGDHSIGGFSQQQGGGQSATFSSQFGQFSLSQLPVVSGDSMTPAQQAPQQVSQWAPEPAPQWQTPEVQAPQAQYAPPGGGSSGDALTQLERVAELHRKGVLSDAEFSAKKAELLSRI